MERSDKDYNGSFCSWFLVHSGKFVPKWRYIEAKKMMTATENCLLIFSIVSSSDFSCMTVRCEDKNWTGLWVNILVMPQIISLIISSVLVIVTDCELHSWLFKHFFSRENQHHQDLISKTTTCNALQWQWQWHVGNTLKCEPRHLWWEGRPDPQTTQKSKSLEPQEVQPLTIKKIYV